MGDVKGVAKRVRDQSREEDVVLSDRDKKLVSRDHRQSQQRILVPGGLITAAQVVAWCRGQGERCHLKCWCNREKKNAGRFGRQQRRFLFCA